MLMFSSEKKKTKIPDPRYLSDSDLSTIEIPVPSAGLPVFSPALSLTPGPPRSGVRQFLQNAQRWRNTWSLRNGRS